ncbi:hypothetical protein MPTA5024_18910 [Microbispora sp. ATCC PTA-5024]|nr:hypothetical protein MPTA5024_18910 [Microbispora sp. ATCC PTA-5024]
MGDDDGRIDAQADPLPSVPSAWVPASVQEARCRAVARTARIASKARTGSAVSRSISQDTVGLDTKDPKNSGWERNIAMSARQSPLNASVRVRSAMTLPASWIARSRRMET